MLYWRVAAVACTAFFVFLLVWLYGVRTTLVWASAMTAFLLVLWAATIPLRARQRRVWREMGLGPDGRPLPEEDDEPTAADARGKAPPGGTGVNAVADVVGRRFPDVAGRALSGDQVRFPADLAGAPALLLCAYRRGTQTDIDRWAAFAARELPGLVAYELPIIPARLWRPLQGWIDGGMRSGVPPSLWSRTVTLYEQGGTVRDFIGDPGGLAAQVVLLDASGIVVLHDGSGFSPAGAAALADAARTPGG